MRKGKGMRGMGKLRIGERVDSDSHPVEVWIKGRRKKGEKSERGKGGKNWRGIWNEEGRREFERRMERVRWKGGGRMEQEEMEREVREAVREVERELREKGGRKRGWWNEECEDRKKEARKELRSKRRRGGEGKEYRRKRKEYKELCERKKKEENER